MARQVLNAAWLQVSKQCSKLLALNEPVRHAVGDDEIVQLGLEGVMIELDGALVLYLSLTVIAIRRLVTVGSLALLCCLHQRTGGLLRAALTLVVMDIFEVIKRAISRLGDVPFGLLALVRTLPVMAVLAEPPEGLVVSLIESISKLPYPSPSIVIVRCYGVASKALPIDFFIALEAAGRVVVGDGDNVGTKRAGALAY